MNTDSTDTSNIAAFLFQRLASVRLGIGIMLLLAVDLGVGYIFVHGNTIIFEPMNEVGLWPWIMTYGRLNLLHTGWFFIFLVLVAGLAVNTLCCTILRLRKLWNRRSPLRIFHLHPCSTYGDGSNSARLFDQLHHEPDLF